jgi:hypothetical protein
MEVDLTDWKTFSELITLTTRYLDEIKGIGDLTVYDIAQRIGLYLSLQPELVYLYAGTRLGAKTLGLGRRQAKLSINELPVPFSLLTPSEIEDCLCIYKDELQGIIS